MPAKDIERLKVNVNAVHVGDAIQLVIGTVGVPDRDYRAGKDRNARFFVYWVTRQDPLSYNLSDKLVLIAFDRGNKVIGTYSNVEGIKTKNWPGAADSNH